MRDKLINSIVTIISCLVGLIICELAYRGWLDWREKARWLERTQFTVYSSSIYQFDTALGFTYRPRARSEVAIIRDGIPQRCRTIVIDENGSPGKGIEPGKFKEPMFIVLGASFTAMVHGGETWPDIFSTLIEKQSGHDAPILNLSRDGYGVLQMFDQAAQLVRDGYRPRALIVSITWYNLTRPRNWIMTLERNGNEEVFMSSVPSLKVAPDTHIRMVFIDRRVTRAWCESLRASAQSDETVKDIEAAFDLTRRADEAFFRQKLNMFNLKECYICNRIRYGRATKEIPANRYDPTHALARFQDDPRFVDDMAAIRASGVPLWLVYLPWEPELRTGHKELTTQERSLLESLKNVVDRTIDLTPEAPMDDDALALTMLPEDYHPSRVGLEYYAQELLRRLVANEHKKDRTHDGTGGEK